MPPAGGMACDRNEPGNARIPVRARRVFPVWAGRYTWPALHPSYTAGVSHLKIRLAFLVACGALVLATACTSSKGELAPAGDTTQVPPVDTETLPAGHPTVPADARELPVEALLSETDLGADWFQESHADAPMTPQDTFFCGKKVEPLPWTHVARFTNDATGSIVIEMSDADAAMAALQQERDATRGCSQWSSSADMKDPWHIDSVAALDVGDEALLEKSSIQFSDPPETGIDYAVLVRAGDVIIRIEENVVGDVASDETAGFARSAYEKLVKATGGN